MKVKRIITFPIIYIVLEPFFLYLIIKDKIRQYKAKSWVTEGLWGSSVYGTIKDRGRLYRGWLNGESFDVVFQTQKICP